MEVGQGLGRLVQLLLGLVQLLLLGPDVGVQGGGAQGEDGLPGGHVGIVAQVADGGDGAVGLALDGAALVILGLAILIGVNFAAVRGGEHGGGVHPGGQSAGVVKGDDRLEVDGPLGGDVAHLMNFVHIAIEVAHHSGDRHGDGLALFDAVFIGIAEIQGQLQLLVVDDGGHGGALGHVLVGLKILHVHQLAGEGGPDGEVGHVLLQVGHVLLQIGEGLAGVVHLVLGGLAVDGVEGLARRHRVAASHQHLLHGAALGQGDGRRLLGLGGAAAGHGALDAADGGGLGVNFPQVAAAGIQKAVQGKAAAQTYRCGHGQGDQPLGHFLLLRPLLFQRGLALGRSRSGSRGLGLDGGHLCHSKYPPSTVLRIQSVQGGVVVSFAGAVLVPSFIIFALRCPAQLQSDYKSLRYS